MRKTWFAVLLVAVVLLSAVTPALAEAGATGKGRSRVRPFALVGRVVATDTGAKTITVTVLRGNSVIKEFIGKGLTVSVTDKTIFRLHGNPRIVIGLEDVKVDDYVSIGGVYMPPALGGKYVALRVVVGVPVPTPTPSPIPTSAE